MGYQDRLHGIDDMYMSGTAYAMPKKGPTQEVMMRVIEKLEVGTCIANEGGSVSVEFIKPARREQLNALEKNLREQGIIFYPDPRSRVEYEGGDE